MHRSVTVTANQGRITVRLDIVADDDEPYADLSAFDETGDELARMRVSPGFRLNARTASTWIANEFRRP